MSVFAEYQRAFTLFSRHSKRRPGADTSRFALKKGLDIPLAGAPSGEVDGSRRVSRVAYTGFDDFGPKRLPTLAVEVGDRVRLGQPLTRRKAYPQVVGTAPASGVVEAIHRGPRRSLETIVIRLDEAGAGGGASEGGPGTVPDRDQETFNAYRADELDGLSRAQVSENLLASGAWLALRTRPFSMIPPPASVPDALFVTAMDTRPLAADPVPLIHAAGDDFAAGLRVLARLTDGPVYVCTRPDAALPMPGGHGARSADGGRQAQPHPRSDAAGASSGSPARSEVYGVAADADLAAGHRAAASGAARAAPGARGPRYSQMRLAEFAGPHPAGLPGTHIHFLRPASLQHVVWHVGWQDVIAIGRLFLTGRIDPTRLIALCGPMVARPRVLRTRLGADTNELIAGELIGRHEARVISGSALNGRQAVGTSAFLGRFHNQLTVLAEGRERELFGWLKPGRGRYSALNLFWSRRAAGERLGLGTSLHGSPRAMVPVGAYDRVTPLDLLPVQLLRALLVDDVETAEALGALELDEEDVALLSFVDCGKHDYGAALRRNLEQIRRENDWPVRSPAEQAYGAPTASREAAADAAAASAVLSPGAAAGETRPADSR